MYPHPKVRIWALFTHFLALELTRELCNLLGDWLQSTSPTSHPAGYIIHGLTRKLKKSENKDPTSFSCFLRFIYASV